jgi:hypothetical protein
MKKTFKFLITLMLCIGTAMPLVSSAATVKSTGNINESSLVATSTRPIISGEATGTKTIRLNIYKEGSSKVLYKSKIIKVKDGVWSTKIYKTLKKGEYDIKLYGSKGLSRDTLETNTLMIGGDKKEVSKSKTTLVVELVPLLVGGTVRPNKVVPVSYLQVTNIGQDFAIVKGFWLKQNGSARTASVVALTTIDDTGILKGSTASLNAAPFKDNSAFAPIPDVVLAPGQMRLFTIKAEMASDVSLNIGKNLVIDVSSIETNATVKGQFPIRGTTWNISN